MSDSKIIFMLLETQFPPDLRVMNEAKVLQRVGHKVYIFSLNYNKLKEKEILSNGVTVIRKSINKKFYNKLRISVLWLPFVNMLWKKFVSSLPVSPDVIHVHDLPLARAGFMLSKKYNAKLVLDLHENFPAALDVWSYSNSFSGKLLLPRWQWKKYEKWAIKIANKVIVVIEEALTRFLDLDNPNEKFCIISNTPNLDELNKIEITLKDKRFENRFNLVYTGGFGPHRGIDVLLKAIPKIKKEIPNVLVWIVGDGADKPDMEKLVENLAVEDYVIFTGFLPMDKMSQIIFHSDVTVLPHIKTAHTETTIPHKLFHYMFWKKPIIASDCTPIKRIVLETKSGLVYSSKDENELSEKVISISSDKTSFGKNGSEAVEKKYNWNVEAEKLLKLYSEL